MIIHASDEQSSSQSFYGARVIYRLINVSSKSTVKHLQKRKPLPQRCGVIVIRPFYDFNIAIYSHLAAMVRSAGVPRLTRHTVNKEVEVNTRVFG